MFKLVGGLEQFLFFHILGILIPTDFHIFSEGEVYHQPVRDVPIALSMFLFKAQILLISILRVDRDFFLRRKFHLVFFFSTW